MDTNNNSILRGGELRAFILLTLLMVMVALGAYTYKALSEGRYTYDAPIIITVAGEGEAFAKPDVATFSFSVRAEAADATAAQNLSAESINKITKALTEKGIEDKDIKTLYYNLNPRYEYEQASCVFGSYCPPGKQVLKGYEVNQTIQVKVRDTVRAGELISMVGEFGATDISGLTFTIDDEDALRADARAKAIEDAEAKIERTAQDLGVRIVRMTSFWEDQGGYPIYGYGGDKMERSVMSADAAVVPNVPTGENTISVRVNVSYEVR